VSEAVDTAGSDLQIDTEDRIQPIQVNTEYIGRYQSVNRIRDIPEFCLDEPTELGGRNSGPTALEITLAALNSCSAMIMYVLRREMKFDLQSVRFETQGFIDVRRIEMRNKGLKYSEVEPVAEHYHKVVQKVIITTTETGERFEHFRSEVHRLCPMHALFRDAKVDLDSQWIQLAPNS
jgi:putative redox protein